MKSVFNEDDRRALLARLSNLKTDSPRQWGKMNASQMLRHCSLVLEMATGDRPEKQRLIGKIIAPFVRTSALSEKPFGRSAPTDPTCVVTDERDLQVERARLQELLTRLVTNGKESAGRYTHSFFGKLSGDEWGTLTHKHLDHHLQQFGV